MPYPNHVLFGYSRFILEASLRMGLVDAEWCRDCLVGGSLEGTQSNDSPWVSLLTKIFSLTH